ncbi:DUF4136 domain-containing protein [Candidatus Omnitrophota bacterium]
MKKTFGYLFVLTLIAAGISGCTTTSEINSQYSRLTNFAGLKTYDWLSDEVRVSGAAILDEGTIDKNVRETVEIELKNKEYVKYPVGTPDFLVQYQVIIEEQTTPAGSGRFYDDTIEWKNNLGPGDQEITEYKKGTLIIDILDAGNKNLLWRGSTEAEIYPYAINTQKIRQIKKAIRVILDHFPPH